MGKPYKKAIVHRRVSAQYIHSVAPLLGDFDEEYIYDHPFTYKQLATLVANYTDKEYKKEVLEMLATRTDDVTRNEINEYIENVLEPNEEDEKIRASYRDHEAKRFDMEYVSFPLFKFFNRFYKIEEYGYDSKIISPLTEEEWNEYDKKMVTLGKKALVTDMKMQIEYYDWKNDQLVNATVNAFSGLPYFIVNYLARMHELSEVKRADSDDLYYFYFIDYTNNTNDGFFEKYYAEDELFRKEWEINFADFMNSHEFEYFCDGYFVNYNGCATEKDLEEIEQYIKCNEWTQKHITSFKVMLTEPLIEIEGDGQENGIITAFRHRKHPILKK